MLPSDPQPIMKVFADGWSAYKKFFMVMLPIFILFGVIQTSFYFIFKSFLIGKSIPMTLGILISLICLWNFYVFWSILLIYDLLTEEKANHKQLFINVSKRFLKAILIFAFGIFLGIGVSLINRYWPTYFNIINNISLVIITILLPWILAFSTVYMLEVLTKDCGILSAFKRAFAISFRRESAWRSLCFIMLFMLTNLILLGVIFILSLMNSILHSLVSGNVLITVSFSLLFPFSLILLINFYHDLVLRFAKVES